MTEVPRYNIGVDMDRVAYCQGCPLLIERDDGDGGWVDVRHVEKLEADLASEKMRGDAWASVLDNLREENAALREALRYYADEETWVGVDNPMNYRFQFGAVAHEALKRASAEEVEHGTD